MPGSDKRRRRPCGRPRRYRTTAASSIAPGVAIVPVQTATIRARGAPAAGSLARAAGRAGPAWARATIRPLERSHSGLVQRFAKPPSGVTCSEGSNPSLSASAPVAQWIERQVADLKAVSSNLAGRATPALRSPRMPSPPRRAHAAWLLLTVLVPFLVACAAPSTNSEPSAASASPSGAATAPSPTPTRQPSPSATPSATAEPVLGAAPLGPTERAIVLRVVDGDTIEVDRGRGPERVRYIGIDTPEAVDPSRPVEWMGPEASAANAALVGGREVVLERDVSETDRYGRLLRYVWVEDAGSPTGWVFVNLALVAAGYAQVATYPPDVRYAELFLVAQAEARSAERGLWGAPPSTPTPRPTSAPKPSSTPADCDPSYPSVCIPPPPPDLDCPDIPYRRFEVLPPDPHRFDADHDGIGCESG